MISNVFATDVTVTKEKLFFFADLAKFVINGRDSVLAFIEFTDRSTVQNRTLNPNP